MGDSFVHVKCKPAQILDKEIILPVIPSIIISSSVGQFKIDLTLLEQPCVDVEEALLYKNYSQTGTLTSLCPWTWELTKAPRMWDVIGR